MLSLVMRKVQVNICDFEHTLTRMELSLSSEHSQLFPAQWDGGLRYNLAHVLHFYRAIFVSQTNTFCVQALYKDTLSSLHELLSNVLGKDPTPDSLQSVFKVGLLFFYPM